MSSAAPPRSYVRGGKVPRNTTRFVPKAETSSSPSSSSSRDNYNPTHRDPPPRFLTTSLRVSSSSSSSAAISSRENGKRGGGGGFVNYLPQDEAVASCLGVEKGGLDAAESQRVVDLLNGELSRLLKMKPKEFWREVACSDSLYGFLDSYLQFRNRWYDFPHRGPKEIVAGVIVGDGELSRRVFMVLYRMSSNKDPGVHSSDCLSAKEHAALLQEKKLLELPKLLDVCAIYGHENEELTRLLVNNAIKVQPPLVDDINATVSHFLSIADTMHQRCGSSLEVLLVSSVGHEDSGLCRLHTDFLEVLDFINDAIVTLDAFVNAYKPAALYLSHPVETSHGNEELLSVLARLHDSMLPTLQRGLLLSYKIADGAHNPFDSTHTDIALSLKMLSMRMVKFGWKLLDICYLSEFPEDGLNLRTATKMFPANVEDPTIRGDILVQTFREINREVSFHPHDVQKNGTFLQNVEKNHNMFSQISSLRSKGWMYIDDEQFHYISQIATPPTSKAQEDKPKVPVSSIIDMPTDEDTAIIESKISQIKDLFPDYGKGFLMACLEAYNQNPEMVIQRILDGTLHEDLLSLDTSLEQAPPPKSVSISKRDKGKGILVEPVSHKSEKGKQVLVESEYPIATLPQKVVLPTQGKNANGSPSLSSSSYGRYTRKTEDQPADSAILDSKAAKDSIRSAVLEAQYEDEYDDSFDELGLGIVESGSEQAEYSGYKSSSLPGKSLESEPESSRNSSSRWSSQKKPQFFVKDGKNYSYKVSGSVSVSNAEDAALVNQAQKEIIHGLGRGGNLPLGAVKKLMESEEEVDEDSSAVQNTGRGHPSSRGRGGRRGGNSHHRKDRAIRKHLAGLGGS